MLHRFERAGCCAALTVFFMLPNTAGAQTYFGDEGLFQAAAGPVTVVNLDAPPLGDVPTPYLVTDLVPDPLFLDLGIDFFFAFVPQVFDGQAFQISKPDRDRLIVYGAGVTGDVSFDLVTPATAIGAWANIGDGGRIQAYSEPLTAGDLLGEADFGGASDFGGMITDMPIRSVRITCDFNFDLVCGVFDIQFNDPTDTDGDGVVDIADNCIATANADQRDSDADGFGNLCDSDLNDDCVVNVLDLGIFKALFFTTDADADFNGDGVVNALDLGILRVNYFLPPGPSGVTMACDGP